LRRSSAPAGADSIEGDAGVTTIDGGSGNDTLLGGGGGAEIYGGAGDDVFYRAGGAGSVLYGGTGANTFIASDETLIADADTDDAVQVGTYVLTGGTRWANFSDIPYAYDGASAVRYALNTVGELVIETFAKLTTFVANYTFDIGGAATAGIRTLEVQIDAYRLLDPNRPNVPIFGWVHDLLNETHKAATGEPYYPGEDPLALDLDGDGLELTSNTTVSPFFDLDGDGFAERTARCGNDNAAHGRAA